MPGSGFEELVELIRESQGFKPDKPISPNSQFERDLGITGDDGNELLRKIEQHYGIRFSANSFELAANEVLFYGEGLDFFGVLWRTVSGKPEPEVRPFTVGHLHVAILKATEAKRKESHLRNPAP